jgi:hypothetical protein
VTHPECVILIGIRSDARRSSPADMELQALLCFTFLGLLCATDAVFGVAHKGRQHKLYGVSLSAFTFNLIVKK